MRIILAALHTCNLITQQSSKLNLPEYRHNFDNYSTVRLISLSESNGHIWANMKQGDSILSLTDSFLCRAQMRNFQYLQNRINLEL